MDGRGGTPGPAPGLASGAGQAHTGLVPVAVIDVSAPWTPAPPQPLSRERHPIVVALFLGLGVLLVLTGPGAFPLPRLILSWRASTSTGFFWLTADTLYTLDTTNPNEVLLSAHDPRSRDVTWSLPLRGPLAQVYASAHPVFTTIFPPTDADGAVTTAAGSLGVLSYPTAALPLVYLAGTLAITVDRDLRVPPEPGSAATGPRWAHLVTARDLRTRSVLWTRRIEPRGSWSLPGVRVGATGIAGLPPGTDWMLVSSSRGALEIWDLRTGATRARRGLTAPSRTTYALALADSVVVSTQSGGVVGLSAYDPGTLAPQWRVVPPLTNAEPLACQPNLCLVTNRAVFIVDPRTGLTTVRVSGTQVRPGPTGRALVSEFGESLAIVTTADGRASSVEIGWRAVDAAAYERFAVVAQVQESARAELGLLDVQHGTVARLGEATRWSSFSQCLANADTIACGDGDTLSAWHYTLTS